MADVRIILSGLWVAVMLIYLLGDVLRQFAGDITPGEIGGRKVSQGMWLGIAVIMLIPIIMVVLSLTLPYPAIGWANIVVAVLVVVFNLFGLRPSACSRCSSALLSSRSPPGSRRACRARLRRCWASEHSLSFLRSAAPWAASSHPRSNIRSS